MKNVSRIIVRILAIRVSLPVCVGVSVFAFILGLGVMDYYWEKMHNTYSAGYQARDLEAYSSLHIYNHGFTVLRVHNPEAFDLLDDDGQTTTGVVFCNPMPNLRSGSRIDPGMQVYYKEGCFSLNGPKAYIQIDQPLNQMAKGERQ